MMGRPRAKNQENGRRQTQGDWSSSRAVIPVLNWNSRAVGAVMMESIQ
jgi:hypothetical protein